MGSTLQSAFKQIWGGLYNRRNKVVGASFVDSLKSLPGSPQESKYPDILKRENNGALKIPNERYIKVMEPIIKEFWSLLQKRRFGYELPDMKEAIKKTTKKYSSDVYKLLYKGFGEHFCDAITKVPVWKYLDDHDTLNYYSVCERIFVSHKRTGYNKTCKIILEDYDGSFETDLKIKEPNYTSLMKSIAKLLLSSVLSKCCYMWLKARNENKKSQSLRSELKALHIRYLTAFQSKSLANKQ